ncbi:MAG: protein arginine kinase [Lentisphaerae bacterium]|nr:protein arginine kinase [Lentisphaerota bacterium]
MKVVDELLKNPGAWLKVGAHPGVMVSSRVRLARNLENTAFPGWAGEDESQRLWQSLRPVLEALPGCAAPVVLEMENLSRLDKEILVERHLISRDLAEKGPGSALVLKADETVALMINEEDHIRMQAMSPGLSLPELWRTIDSIDTDLAQQVRYAFSPRLGYLTACPTNVGTGMRASVMLHLPGLVLMNEINPIVKGVNKIGLAVRGLWGEGTDAAGNMFQISNQTTLGETEQTIISRLEQIVLEIEEHEKHARARLLQQKEISLRDHVGRACGILTNACLLNSRETMDMLSALRLGIELGLLREWSAAVIDELFLLIQPGHLQKVEGRIIGAEKRDLARARLVRARLSAADKRQQG